MKRLIILYSFIVTSLIFVVGLIVADQDSQYLYTLLYAPMVLFFARQLILPYLDSNPSSSGSGFIPIPFKPRSNAPTPPKKPGKSLQKYQPDTAIPQDTNPEEGVIDPEQLSDEEITDINKRLFLKLIGSAGLGLFVFSLFSKQSHAAFFGSMPGPGIIKIKDSSDNVIDPAEKQPTDGYEITDVDDSTLPAYYGFMDKDGNWYIAREGVNSEFRYVAGSSNFATAWANRVTQTYNYFNNVF